jgi:hypothetical protein
MAALHCFGAAAAHRTKLTEADAFKAVESVKGQVGTGCVRCNGCCDMQCVAAHMRLLLLLLVARSAWTRVLGRVCKRHLCTVLSCAVVSCAVLCSCSSTMSGRTRSKVASWM